MERCEVTVSWAAIAFVNAAGHDATVVGSPEVENSACTELLGINTCYWVIIVEAKPNSSGLFLDRRLLISTKQMGASAGCTVLSVEDVTDSE